MLLLYGAQFVDKKCIIAFLAIQPFEPSNFDEAYSTSPRRQMIGENNMIKKLLIMGMRERNYPDIKWATSNTIGWEG